MQDGRNAWRLKPGMYRAYGVRSLLVSADGLRGTPRQSSTSSFQTPPLNLVKVESVEECVTILSSDSDQNSPEFRLSSKTPSSVSTLPRFTSLPASTVEKSSAGFTSVIDCLHQLREQKGCWNILSKIDYDSICTERVHTLPPSFNGNIIFELPPIEVDRPPSYAHHMAGMDKWYDGHVWTKTMTTNITNRMGLTFRTSACVGVSRTS